MLSSPIRSHQPSFQKISSIASGGRNSKNMVGKQVKRSSQVTSQSYPSYLMMMAIVVSILIGSIDCLGVAKESSSIQRTIGSTKIPPPTSLSASSSPLALPSPFSHMGYQIRDTSSLPNIFHLPYEKLANPLSTFLSWISSSYKSDQHVRTYDLLYSKPASGRTPPEESLDDSVPAASRRFDILSSFTLPKWENFGKGMSRAYTNEPYYRSKTLPKTQTYDIQYPRYMSSDKQKISPHTMKLIQKYAPNPKVYFYPQYYQQQYHVPVPFMTQNNVVYSTNGALRSQKSTHSHFPSTSSYHHTRRPSSYSKHYLGNIGYSTTTGFRGAPSKDAAIQPLSEYSNSLALTSSGGRSINGGGDAFWDSTSVRKPAPYTGKAQYSAIDNSADPISPSASKQQAYHAIPKLSSAPSTFSPSKSMIKISELSNARTLNKPTSSSSTNEVNSVKSEASESDSPYIQFGRTRISFKPNPTGGITLSVGKANDE